jgi:hypothetical protein
MVRSSLSVPSAGPSALFCSPSSPLTPFTPLTSRRNLLPKTQVKVRALKPFKYIEQRVMKWFNSIGLRRGDPLELKTSLVEKHRQKIRNLNEVDCK